MPITLIAAMLCLSIQTSAFRLLSILQRALMLKSAMRKWHEQNQRDRNSEELAPGKR